MRSIPFTCLMLAAAGFIQAQPLTHYVDPFIGTRYMGHTWPGATVPFGMVQLSPDTDTTSYELEGAYNPAVYAYCAGYQYEDPTILGFSHTHFSGTGHSDLGDFLIAPTSGALQLTPGTAAEPASGYRSAFRHSTESARPGYYRVLLDDHQIMAELTTTARVGLHRYTFAEKGPAHIILDLIHGIYNFPEKNVWTFLRVENDSTVTGYRQTTGWARTRTLHFAMVFSKPFIHYGHKKYDRQVYRGFYRKFDETAGFPEMAGRQIRAHFDFEMDEGEQLLVKVALSPVSIAGALANLETELSHWNFEQVAVAADKEWNRELGRIQVETLTPEDKTVFYTALYHAFLGPTLYMDADGSYRGLDQQLHRADGFVNYSTFSLWDTYRALHPLFNLIQPRRNGDMINSMLAHFRQSVHPMLPVWSHHANENWCMIGYHAVSVIADAAVKGNRSFDLQEALSACVQTASYDPYDGISWYRRLGYVPEDRSSSSVSKTLEYAYDDWAIARLAEQAGRAEVSHEFTARSESWRQVYDPAVGYMRPRLEDGRWKSPFDVLSTHGQGFIEGNAWNYSLYVPHNIPEMIRLMGGKRRFVRHLDSLFTMDLADENFAATEDITRHGIIGGYVHGNEPGHHIPYLYNWAGRPEKTQERVRQILRRMYTPAPDGLCGNDDCGQMSAWYLFSALGFYPVCPGATEYALGSPLVTSARIEVGEGRFLEITVVNQSEENVYVRRVEFNGKQVSGQSLDHAQMAQGGRLVFTMAARP